MKQAENKFIVVTDMREAVGVEEVVGRKVVVAVDHIVPKNTNPSCRGIIQSIIKDGWSLDSRPRSVARFVANQRCHKTQGTRIVQHDAGFGSRRLTREKSCAELISADLLV